MIVLVLFFIVIRIPIYCKIASVFKMMHSLNNPSPFNISFLFDIYKIKRLSMQIEDLLKGIDRNKQTSKISNPKRHNQEALLTIDITPKKYRGMIFLGNFSSAAKHNIQQTPELKDPRLSYLDYAYFTNKKVLDVGSGEGLLTIQIAMRCFPAKIIALDIDTHLLEKLKKKVDKIVAKNVLYSKSSQVVLKRVQQLPLFFQQQFEKSRAHNSFSGSKIVEIMTEGEQFKSRFPDNFCFYNQNFMNIQDKQKYDTLLLMKTSKWMHLSFGDKGLTSLFQKAFQLLVPGGIMILEYPLYRSYKKKKSLNNLYQQNMKDNIHIDPLSFPNILEHMGFSLIRQIEVNVQKGLKHPIAVFIKKQVIEQ